MTLNVSAERLGGVNFKDGSNTAGAELACAGPTLHVGLTMRSEIETISPFVDRLMLLIKISHCVPGDDRDVEIALREALANAVLHGNKQDPHKKVHISCRLYPGRKLSIVVQDEGNGFDPVTIPDPTAFENTRSANGRGICLMRLFMDLVHFDQGGRQVRLEKGFKQKPDKLFQRRTRNHGRKGPSQKKRVSVTELFTSSRR